MLSPNKTGNHLGYYAAWNTSTCEPLMVVDLDGGQNGARLSAGLAVHPFSDGSFMLGIDFDKYVEPSHAELL